MKLLSHILIVAIAGILSACSSTTITEYDQAGNVVKVTKSSENAFVLLASSLEKKDNIAHISSWCAGVNPSANIYGIGSFDAVIASINNETGAANALSYATMIDSSKVKLDITANKDGITAKAQTNETNKPTSQAETK